MADELPSHEPTEDGPSHRDQDDYDGYTAHGKNGSGPTRAQTALVLQKACKNAVQRVRQNNMLANSKWAEPLTAAPTAISVMAFLLKTASDKRAAGLKVGSTEVKDGLKVIGKLPSEYFHTNLMHCSDLGRLAFLEAQKRMYKINRIAESMMEEGGGIGYIIELLEDPEDAVDNLKPAMEEIQTTAKECRENCQEVTKRFEYWHAVINHLSTTALDLHGRKIEMGKAVESKIGVTQDNAKIYNDDAMAAASEMQRLSEQLNRAIARVSRAQNELDRLRSLPPIREPSHYEEVEYANRLVPTTSAPKAQRGWLADTATSLFGMYRREDEALVNAHSSRQQGQRSELIAEERSRRRALIEKAEAELSQARKTESDLYDEIEKTEDALTMSETRLIKAKAQLAKAGSDLKNLKDQKLELADILEILRESTAQLGELKKKLEDMVLFFASLETDMEKEVMNKVDKFVKAIKTNTKPGPDGGEARLKLQGPTKKMVLDHALQIQGRFSTISDISAAYVEISNSCIRVAIDKMEHLATVKEDDWEKERAIFQEWCQGTVDSIDQISRKTSANMTKNMEKRIGMLKTLAIEAAAEHEDQ